MTIPKPPFSFDQFVKYPVYAVCFILIIYFMYKEFIQKDSCSEDNRYLKQELSKARREKDDLTTALLIKNGIIFKQELEKKELDSTLRQKVGVKAKSIIGGN